MIGRVKKWWKQYRCSHPFLDCRYKTDHYRDGNLPMVVAERGCTKCGKFLHRFAAVDWAAIPKDTKK